jgi:hypothetical protein
MGSPIQYAELPTFQYQSLENRFSYQTFDRFTAQFSYHPISQNNLTAKNQDNKPTATEPEKDQASETPPKDETSSSSDGTSSPEGEGLLRNFFIFFF